MSVETLTKKASYLDPMVNLDLFVSSLESINIDPQLSSKSSLEAVCIDDVLRSIIPPGSSRKSFPFLIVPNSMVYWSNVLVSVIMNKTPDPVTFVGNWSCF